MIRTLLTALLVTAATTVWAQTPGPFTRSQADTGRDAYLASCAGCHGKTLQGGGEAPALTGATFMSGWGKRDTKSLYAIIKASMPMGHPDSLGAGTYAAITAFLLRANGAVPDTTAFTLGTAVAIASVTNGKMPADVTAAIAAAKPATAPAAKPKEKTGITVAGTVAHYTPVTDEALTHPADGDWPMHLRTYQGWSYSPLTQIDAANVENLQLKWVWAMQDEGRQQMNPLVHDGVMFLSNNLSNIVQALDARTSTLIWENHIGPTLVVENATRTMALWQNLLIYPGTNGILYGLDARNGHIMWKTNISANGNKIGGLMVVRGKVIIGLTRCDDRPTKEHCFIGAYDPATGKPDWKFVTVALKGQPGGESWNNQPDDMRSGGDAWVTGTYDPVSNTTYWGTGQAKPHLRSARGTGDGATDYTNSTVALDADSGKLRWWLNHAPGESLDLDEVFERTVVDHDGRHELITVGKTGIMWKMDRDSGKYLDNVQTVFQNVYSKIDPRTGIPTYRPDIVHQKAGDMLASCPSAEGGHDWPSTSYDPVGDLILVPLSQTCFLFGGSTQEVYEMPGTDGNLGRLSAYHAGDFKPAWSFQQRAPFLTGVISTAGGVSFIGDFDRVFRAIDTRTGQTLWQTRLGTTVQGYPVSFSVDGEQFIAVTTGVQGGSPEQKPTLLLKDEIARPANGQAVYVFGLPHHKQ